MADMLAVASITSDEALNAVAEAVSSSVAYDTDSRCYTVVVALARAELMVSTVG